MCQASQGTTTMAAPRYPRGKWLGQCANTSGRFKAGQPKFIIQHYTAGGNGLGTAKYLMGNNGRASCHFVVDRDGTVYQISELDRVTWHAGQSFYRGLSMLNQYSFGIENANYGYLRKTSDPTKWLTGASNYKSTITVSPDLPVVERAHKAEPGLVRGWEPYPPDQLEAISDLTAWLIANFPTIREIEGHDTIAPKRKLDPGPAFPMRRMQNLMHPNGEGEKPKPDPDNPDPVKPPVKRFSYRVNAKTLNVRGGPGVSFDLLDDGPLQKGAVVQLLKEDGEWAFIAFKGNEGKAEGWVFSQYLTPT